MRSLVTGCAGFIGSHLTEALLGDGEAVVGVDCFNDNYGRPEKLRNLERATEWDGFEFVPIDLARGDLYDLVEECDQVFHLAAEPGVRPSWGERFEQYVRNNVLATQHLLEAARQLPERRFVFASSSSIYGQAEHFPTPEDVIPRPYSPYGVTKLAAEHLCDLYHRNHGVSAVSLRLFSVYGPRQRPDMAFNIFCRAAILGEPVSVFGDGTQTRDFTYVADVVTSLRLAADTAGIDGEVLNIGGGSRVGLREAIELLEGLSGRRLEATYTEQRHGDVRDTCADTSRAQGALAFVPRTSLVDGLRAELEWTRESLQPETVAPSAG
jgi:UDP-glucuronate 4-epimerase